MQRKRSLTNTVQSEVKGKSSKRTRKNVCSMSMTIFVVRRYKTPPRAILRHIILSDFKEKVPLAPFINKETEPILMYDPLPPHDSVNIYKRPVISNGSRLLPDASPLSMFFQSLLPDFNVQDRTFVAPEIHRAHVDQLNQAALDNLLDGAEGRSTDLLN